MRNDVPGDFESRRLEVLRSLEILDTPEEPIFQDAAILAARICGATIALVSLVESNRQWFKSKVGLDITETSRDVSFCSHAIQQDAPFVVEDATVDDRFSQNDLVTGDFHLRFYAGAPVYADEVAVGTVCVLGKEPRRISEEQVDSLMALARQVSANLQLRLNEKLLAQRERELRAALDQQEGLARQLSASSNLFKSVIEALPSGCSLLDQKGTVHQWNLASSRIFGVPADRLMGQNLFDFLPSPARDVVREQFNLVIQTQLRADPQLCLVEQNDGSESYVLIESAPLLDLESNLAGVIGTSFDVTALKLTEQRLAETNQVLETQRAALFVATQTLEDSERFVRALADSVPGLIAYWDSHLKCRFANSEYEKWFGLKPSEVVGMQIWDLLGDAVYALNKPYIDAALEGRPQVFERTLVKPDGTVGHTQAHYIPDLDSDGQVMGFAVLVSDVTRLKQIEMELRLGASVFENTDEGILITDVNGNIMAANGAFSRITGYQVEDVLGLSPSIFRSDRHDAQFYQDIWSSLADNGRWVGETWNRRKNGELFLQMQTISAVSDDVGKPVRFVSVFRDVTDKWRNDERILRFAMHDAVTGLPNRYLLRERLEQHAAQYARDKRDLAVMFCDLDGFKAVNDSLGHSAGDTVLVRIGERFAQIVRQADTVARLGGDEFVVLLDNPRNLEEVEQVAERMLSAVRQPIVTANGVASVGVSIGIAMFEGKDDSIDQLLARADRAMYAAKAAGKHQYKRL